MTFAFERNRADTPQQRDYRQVLFHVGRWLQAWELNELQSYQRSQLAEVAGLLGLSGRLITSADPTQVNQNFYLNRSVVVLDNQVYEIPGRVLEIGEEESTATVGFWHISQKVTSTDDGTLLNPAVDEDGAHAAGYGEPGADRLREFVVFGFSTSPPDEANLPEAQQNLTYHKIYDVREGTVLVDNSAGVLATDLLRDALARYDRSLHPNRVISGLRVHEEQSYNRLRQSDPFHQGSFAIENEAGELEFLGWQVVDNQTGGTADVVFGTGQSLLPEDAHGHVTLSGEGELLQVATVREGHHYVVEMVYDQDFSNSASPGNPSVDYGSSAIDVYLEFLPEPTNVPIEDGSLLLLEQVAGVSAARSFERSYVAGAAIHRVRVRVANGADAAAAIRLRSLRIRDEDEIALNVEAGLAYVNGLPQRLLVDRNFIYEPQFQILENALEVAVADADLEADGSLLLTVSEDCVQDFGIVSGGRRAHNLHEYLTVRNEEVTRQQYPVDPMNPAAGERDRDTLQQTNVARILRVDELAIRYTAISGDAGDFRLSSDRRGIDWAGGSQPTEGTRYRVDYIAVMQSQNVQIVSNENVTRGGGNTDALLNSAVTAIDNVTLDELVWVRTRDASQSGRVLHAFDKSGAAKPEHNVTLARDVDPGTGQPVRLAGYFGMAAGIDAFYVIEDIYVDYSTTAQNVARTRGPSNEDRLPHSNVVSVQTILDGAAGDTEVDEVGNWSLQKSGGVDVIRWTPGGSGPSEGGQYRVSYTYRHSTLKSFLVKYRRNGDFVAKVELPGSVHNYWGLATYGNRVYVPQDLEQRILAYAVDDALTRHASQDIKLATTKQYFRAIAITASKIYLAKRDYTTDRSRIHVFRRDGQELAETITNSEISDIQGMAVDVEEENLFLGGRNVGSTINTRIVRQSLTGGTSNVINPNIGLASRVEGLGISGQLYRESVDFQIGMDRSSVDWSLSGVQPPTGATYRVTYRHHESTETERIVIGEELTRGSTEIDDLILDANERAREGSLSNVASIVGDAQIYTEGVDYELVDNDVHWLAGSPPEVKRPANNAQYVVSYIYGIQRQFDLWSPQSVRLRNAVVGSELRLPYSYKVLKTDRLVLAQTGQLQVQEKLTAGAGQDVHVADANLNLASIEHLCRDLRVTNNLQVRNLTQDHDLDVVRHRLEELSTSVDVVGPIDADDKRGIFESYVLKPELSTSSISREYNWIQPRLSVEVDDIPNDPQALSVPDPTSVAVIHDSGVRVAGDFTGDGYSDYLNSRQSARINVYELPILPQIELDRSVDRWPASATHDLAAQLLWAFDALPQLSQARDSLDLIDYRPTVRSAGLQRSLTITGVRLTDQWTGLWINGRPISTELWSVTNVDADGTVGGIPPQVPNAAFPIPEGLGQGIKNVTVEILSADGTRRSYDTQYRTGVRARGRSSTRAPRATLLQPFATSRSQMLSTLRFQRSSTGQGVASVYVELLELDEDLNPVDILKEANLDALSGDPFLYEWTGIDAPVVDDRIYAWGFSVPSNSDLALLTSPPQGEQFTAKRSFYLRQRTQTGSAWEDLGDQVSLHCRMERVDVLTSPTAVAASLSGAVDFANVRQLYLFAEVDRPVSTDVFFRLSTENAAANAQTDTSAVDFLEHQPVHLTEPLTGSYYLYAMMRTTDAQATPVVGPDVQLLYARTGESVTQTYRTQSVGLPSLGSTEAQLQLDFEANIPESANITVFLNDTEIFSSVRERPTADPDWIKLTYVSNVIDAVEIPSADARIQLKSGTHGSPRLRNLRLNSYIYDSSRAIS